MRHFSLNYALSKRAAVIAALLALVTLYANYLSVPLLVWCGAIAALLVATVGLFRLNREPIEINVNPERDELILKYKRWIGRSTKRMPLSPFTLVRSYSGGGPLPVTVVELATTEELPRAIRLATFEEPTSNEKQFLAIPRFIEAPGARILRETLSTTGVFQDQGYLGKFQERRAEHVE